MLESYLAAFNSALSKQGFTRLYIDAFAGTGRCDVAVEGARRTIDGSARRALDTKPPFHRFCFIDKSSRKLKQLRELAAEYPHHSVDFVHGDANDTLKQLCGSYDWMNTRAVLFLDPFGMHVEWSTLQAIANTEAIDVWYLFPYSALYRQAAVDPSALDDDKEQAINRLLGTNEWRSAFYSPERQQSLFGDERESRDVDHTAMLDYFSERLKTLFPGVAKPKVLYQAGDTENPSGAPLFALYFAAANPRAVKLALRIANGVLDAL